MAGSARMLSTAIADLRNPILRALVGVRLLTLSTAALVAPWGWLVTAITWAGATIVSVVAAIFTPVGAVIATIIAIIVAAGFAIWKYWDRISAFARGFAGPFIGLIRRGATSFSRLFRAAFNRMMEFFGLNPATVARWKQMIVNALDISALW